ncbi:MAG: triose-phosphate isomerase [Deltaproteobacteria bacterium]|nr:triose-phosphate isomerase [Deltaproteobacteria bacterium]
MRKRLIVANWKMNMLRREAKELAERIINLLNDLRSSVDVVLAPPYTSLDVVYRVVRESKIQLGAQNVFWEAWGAVTGEISPYMLTDIGCKWAIIGHSERRNILRETDIMVQKKIKTSLDAGLTPVFCVGETIGEREKGKTINVIESQIEIGLKDVKLADSANLVIAYEPVWAIGTGNNATPKEIEHLHGVIREITGGILGQIASDIRVLYGGSVNPENIKEILATPNVDGALVGGASLRADSFGKIVQLAGE